MTPRYCKYDHLIAGDNRTEHIYDGHYGCRACQSAGKLAHNLDTTVSEPIRQRVADTRFMRSLGWFPAGNINMHSSPAKWSRYITEMHPALLKKIGINP